MPENPSAPGRAPLLYSAVGLIQRHGYIPAPPFGPEAGYSVSAALCAVTECVPPGRHTGLCEELHGQVAGYLYLTGRATEGRLYLPDVVDLWEIYRPGEGWRTQAEVAAVLAGAAIALAVAEENQQQKALGAAS